jgi:hypothetical protein
VVHCVSFVWLVAINLKEKRKKKKEKRKCKREE